ncbi:alpha/beta hydrolase [Kitasatospora sp. NPDC052868]|uniref:alpha/beta hydrolase n=1 Tax=Kitasatospora sp. NPDC052868 TaxID=3364060 RepID=UPI0037CBEA41
MSTVSLAVTWNPIDWSLIHGPIPRAVLLAGWGSLLALAVSRGRPWWNRRLPAALVLAALLTKLVDVAVDDWWHPFPEGLPRYVIWWIAWAVTGFCLLGFRVPRLARRGRVLAAVGAALVLLMGASQVNRGFEQYPSGRVMLAPWLSHTQELTTSKEATTVSAPPGKVLADVWHAPPGLPAKGTVSKTPIPGVKSGFKARDAYVYLPPAYQASPRPLLPVVVMLGGQPGVPEDWVHTAQLNETLDAFAAEHDGLAPIVVMPDQLGSTWANPLCLDSKIGKTQTYLAEDVPNWVRHNLQASEDRRSWVIGGASMGGTCALQLAVNAPQVYGVFLDMAGQEEPTLGSRAETVKAAFDGDEAAFTAVNPLDVMSRKRFPDTVGAIVVGEKDDDFVVMQRRVYEAALAAGMTAKFDLMPGGHGWVVFRPSMVAQVPWLAQQTGLTR